MCRRSCGHCVLDLHHCLFHTPISPPQDVFNVLHLGRQIIGSLLHAIMLASIFPAQSCRTFVDVVRGRGAGRGAGKPRAARAALSAPRLCGSGLDNIDPHHAPFHGRHIRPRCAHPRRAGCGPCQRGDSTEPECQAQMQELCVSSSKALRVGCCRWNGCDYTKGILGQAPGVRGACWIAHPELIGKPLLTICVPAARRR